MMDDRHVTLVKQDPETTLWWVDCPTCGLLGGPTLGYIEAEAWARRHQQAKMGHTNET